MSKAVYVASGYCDAAVRNGTPKNEIMRHLDTIYHGSDDDACLLQKLDHEEIWLIFDDSRPSELIYKLPKGYK